MAGRQKLSPDVVDAVWLASMAALVWLISGGLVTRAALDTDAVNLALAIERFDLAAHQPHPPGYLGYVMLLRGLDAITGLAPLEVVVLASRLLVVASLPLVYAAGRAIAGRRAALLAAALIAGSPLSLYYAIDGQTHAAEMVVAAALLWRLAVTWRGARAPLANAIAVGVLLALGGSLRPSFALIAVGPALWCYWRRWRPLAVVVAVGAAGTAAWAIPTVILAGGWARYQAASDALIGMFARSTSAISGEADARMVADNRVAAALWIGMIAAPLAVAGLLRLAGGGSSGARFALIYAAVSAAPALGFFAFVFIAEPGYAIGLVPAVALAAAAIGDLDRLVDRLVMWSCAAAQLSAFMLAPTTGDSAAVWVPSVAEIAYRQSAAEIVVDRVNAGAEPGDRVLVIADRGPTALYRQLPLLRPNTDVLFVHSATLAIHESTTLSLSRADDWLALPGPVLLADGPPSVLRVRARYHHVAVGPLYSDELRATLAAQSRCSIPAPDASLSTPHLSPDCFADAAIEIEGHRFEWARERDELVAR